MTDARSPRRKPRSQAAAVPGKTATTRAAPAKKLPAKKAPATKTPAAKAPAKTLRSKKTAPAALGAKAARAPAGRGATPSLKTVVRPRPGGLVTPQRGPLVNPDLTPVTPVTPGRVPGPDLGPIGPVVPGIPPVLFTPTHGNLFTGGRPGSAVVREDDLVALRIELVNLVVQPGAAGEAPRCVHSGSGQAYVVLHLPPQSFGEQTFFLVRDTTEKSDGPKGGGPADGNEALTGPPVKARIAHESRLAFKAPAGFEAPYTLAGLLAACAQLEPSVPANAKPRGAGGLRPLPFPLPDVVTTRLDPKRFAQVVGGLNLGANRVPLRPVGKGAALKRTGGASAQAASKAAAGRRARPAGQGAPVLQASFAELAQLAVRQQRLAAIEGLDSPTLALRQDAVRFVPGLADIDIRPIPLPINGPAPAEPKAHQTAIEMPWRLVLSPHAALRWRHAAQPVTSALTGRTELWHSTLIAPPKTATESLIEPPRFDPVRTVSAVWARTGQGAEVPEVPMGPSFPPALPAPDDAGTRPFRTPMDDFDRYQIVHLSSNFSHRTHVPQPVDANLLMLSTLGGWFDARGFWDSKALGLEEWVHRASMGRDHYVRLVYKGVLFPFGHRVVLVKVTERMFHNGGPGLGGVPAHPGNTAYLRQRLFIVVRERERRYDGSGLTSPDGSVLFERQFPFSTVRLLTTTTPDLMPTPTKAVPGPQRLFWPMLTNTEPFRFQCVATDLEGRKIGFELPMLFMDQALAAPVDGALKPDFVAAKAAAARALAGWMAPAADVTAWRTPPLRGQRVALAPSGKPGDTSVEAQAIEFGAEVDAQGNSFATYSQKLSRPMFFPSVRQVQARLAPLATLTGSTQPNTLTFNPAYLKNAFAGNVGQVFANVAPAGATLDFSSQGDRSGGFVMPNLAPSGLSRLAGPVSGAIDKIVSGAPQPADLFSGTGVPMPLLFGCIKLSDVVQALGGGQALDAVPKFVTEAASAVESLIGDAGRLLDGVDPLPALAGQLARAALDVAKATALDLVAQGQSLVGAPVQAVRDALAPLNAAYTDLQAALQALLACKLDPQVPTDVAELDAALAAVQAKIAEVDAKLADLAAAAGVPALPAGWAQSLKQAVQGVRTVLADLQRLPALRDEGRALLVALKALIAHFAHLDDLASEAGKTALLAEIDAVQVAAGPLRATLAALRLLDGAPRQAVLGAMDVLAAALTGGEKLVELLGGEELTVRFDWNPEIGPVPASGPIFRPNDRRGLLVAVEARMKKSGGPPKVGVVCSLKHFDLILIGAAGFIELNFEKIEFRADSGLKTNVDVLLSDIKFIGPLSFVETLRDLIPLDGFSDPPYLDITPQGIDAGFSIALPNVAVGIFSLTNLSLGAGFTVPFIGQPLSVRFNFCTREQPFNLTVSLLGGGGFFGITIDPRGVQILEAALEFGACLSVNLGVASGSVHIMAGIYFRMQQDTCRLAGYLRLGGEVDVLGLISASIELYLELSYEPPTGKAAGRATITVEVSVFMFSFGVKVSCERKFAGSNGDPSFRQLMGPLPTLPGLPAPTLADELAALDAGEPSAWREYVHAFA